MEKEAIGPVTGSAGAAVSLAPPILAPLRYCSVKTFSASGWA
jgi:hypothetical protein